MHEVAQILLYGLLAAASPTALLATLVILGSGRGRVNGVAFMAGFLLGQSIAFLVVFFVGSAFSEGEHGTATAYLELATGVVLLGIAWRERLPRAQEASFSSSRTHAVLARLTRVKPSVSFGIGFPLGIGAKRLAITILAAGTIALSGLSSADEIGLSLLYVVVATVIVWFPVSLYLILGRRSDDLVASSRAWITQHQQRLTFLSALALGVLFIVDGLVKLV